MIRPWMFVVTGVLLTVGSAVLTHAVIVEKNHKLVQLDGEMTDIERRIDQHWQQAKSLEYEEQNGTIILLFSALKNKESATPEALNLALTRYVEKILLSGRVAPEKAEAIRTQMKEKGGQGKTLEEIFRLVDANRIEAIETINNLYSEKQTLAQEQAGLRTKIRNFSMIALLLQILGLILVLSKDLMRKTPAESTLASDGSNLNFS